MPASAQQCERIAAALGDLASQEAASLGQDDFATVLTIQDRAAPLVAFLAENIPLLDGGVPAGVRVDLAAIFERRAQTAALLDDKVSALRASMAEARAAQGRAARVAPVYGSRRGAGTSGHLLAQG